MGQIRYGEYAALVLAGLNAPITQNNIDKLSAIFAHEGTKAAYNPMAWNRKFGGQAGSGGSTGSAPSTNFNSVGVQNYPNLGVGVKETVAGLSQVNTAAMTLNLRQDGSYTDFLSATNAYYQSWKGTGPGDMSQAEAHKAAGTSLISGDVTPGDIEGTAKALTPDPKVVKQLATIIPGVYPNGIADNPPGGIAGVLWSVGAVEAAPVQAVTGAISNTLDFVKAVWNALTSKNNWLRVGLVVGALLLVVFGLYIVSRSFGGPSATDVTKDVI